MNLNKLHYVQKYDRAWEQPYYEKHLGIPEGFMVCDGSRLSKFEFPDLFDTIGKAYDDTDGKKDPNSFLIPDLRGHFNGQPAKVSGGDVAFIIKTLYEPPIPGAPAPLPVGTVVQYHLGK